MHSPPIISAFRLFLVQKPIYHPAVKLTSLRVQLTVPAIHHRAKNNNGGQEMMKQ